MPWYKIVLALIFPPLAVLDKGVKAIVLTSILTFFGWIPGVVAALIYASRPAES